MSVNRCILALSRVHVKHGIRNVAVPLPTTTAHKLWTTRPAYLQDNGLYGCLQRRNASSNSPSHPPDTSLFVPISIKSETAGDGSVGLELTEPLDKGNVIYYFKTQNKEMHVTVHTKDRKL